MAINIIDAIYLGTMADLDTFEGNYFSENAASLVGTTFGSVGSPLVSDIGQLTLNDTNYDGGVTENDWGAYAEDITFDGTASALDSTLIYSVTITFTDGSTATTEMILLQDVSGRVFLTPHGDGLSENLVLDDGYIESLTLDSVASDGYFGVVADLEQNAFLTCFTAGTMIETPFGATDIAALNVGDFVRTMDNGMQPIRWIGTRRVRALGTHAPVLIMAGALGPGMPAQDLRVSQQHRVLIRSKITRRMFGQDEVLIPALKLLEIPGICLDESRGGITYLHILFARHEIVFSNGAATESLYPGPLTLKGLSPESRRELFDLFPELATYGKTPISARKIIRGGSQRKMVERHYRNRQDLFHPEAFLI